ncbi:MAG: hypothetical protein ACR2O6_02200 [Ilumatobacteraceae bacterium]
MNAYELHDHLYDELRRRPAAVLVRWSGIVASRVLQRLFDDVEPGIGRRLATDTELRVGTR